MPNNHLDLVTTASQLLEEYFGQDIQLTLDEEILSQQTVLRCRLLSKDGTAPSTVILKQIPMDEMPQPDLPDPSLRFRNEWAVLHFLSQQPAKQRFSPRLYVSQSDLGLMILEDLGVRPTLEDILYGDDYRAASAAMDRFGRALGGIHAGSQGLEMEFQRVQARYNATTPITDATIDLRNYTETIAKFYSAFEIRTSPELFRTLEKIEADIHGPGPFRLLCHNDAGAHNVLDMSDRVKMIDMERAGFQHALTDLVAAGLGFPSSNKGRRSPPEVVARLERAYQIELSQTIPEAADEHHFQRERETACAHVVLAKLMGIWKFYLQEHLAADEAFDQHGARTGKRFDYVLRGAATYLTTYLTSTEDTCHRPIIRDLVQALHNSLLRLWPTMTPLPLYPAFEAIALD